MNLTHCEIGQDYIVKNVNIIDDELRNFLFTLGCYSGERITLIYKSKKNYIVAIKDSRYSIDANLAALIDIVC